MISLRKRISTLRRGDFIRLLADDGIYCFARILGEQIVLIALNASGREQQIEIPCAGLGWKEGRVVQGLIDNQKSEVAGGTLTIHLGPWSGTWIG